MRIDITIGFLLAIGVALALNVSVTDSTGFEIDTFNIGETAVITAESEDKPFIAIYGPNYDGEKEPMKEVGEEMYNYELLIQEKGTYEVEVHGDGTIVKNQLFATQDLSLEWEEMVEENKEEELSRVVPEEERRNAFQRFLDFIKRALGIINE